MSDHRVSGIDSLGRVNLNYIKSRLQLSFALRQIKRCRGADPLLLSVVHKLSCLCEFCRSTELDLYKYEVFLVAHDKVDFALAAHISSGEQFIVLFAQVLCGQGFAPSTG